MRRVDGHLVAGPQESQVLAHTGLVGDDVGVSPPGGVGRSVEFHHRKAGTGWRWEPRPISANDTGNGATYDLWIG